MEYWYLWLVLAVLIVVFIFGAFKASQASAKRKAEIKKITDRLDYLKKLKAEYSDFSADRIESYDEKTLFDGVAFYLQNYLEQFTDSEMKQKYESFNDRQKFVYTASNLLEDCEDASLCEFFRRNGTELTALCVQAVKAVFGNEQAVSIVSQQYEMFDGESDISIDYEKVDTLDKMFADLLSREDFRASGAQYIKENANFFEIHK